MMGGTFHRYTLVAVCDLFLLACFPTELEVASNLVIMNVVIRSNCVDTIVATQITSPDGQMICLHIDRKVKNNVEFRAVHENQVVD